MHAFIWVKVLPEWMVGFVFLVFVSRGLGSFLACCEGGGTAGRGGGGIPKRTAGGVEGAPRESV